MPREQATIGAFTDRESAAATTDRDVDPSPGDSPSRWVCPDCAYSAEYDLHAPITPSCPRCLPDTFVYMER